VEWDSLTPDVGFALMKLAHLGFRFKVAGDRLAWRHESEPKPDPAKVRPLLDIVKANKADALFFLSCHCPRCGGIVFVRDDCFICDWLPQTIMSQAQDSDSRDEVLLCGGCGHFIPSRINPEYGFGRCALVHLSKRTGAYPGKTACPHFEASVGEGTLRLTQ
jgi:hypothetical protein